LDLEGKTVIITGAARGIGRGIAGAFARVQARVVLADIGNLRSKSMKKWPYSLSSCDDLKSATQDILDEGGEALGIEVDVSNAASCRNLIEQTCDAFDNVDILVNNAGLIKAGPIAGFKEGDWDLLFDVNVKGIFLTSRAVIPRMATNGGGSIINISSIAGKKGYPLLGAYSASKFAAIGLTQSMAVELADFSIRVNAICPGSLATAMWSDHLSQLNLFSDLNRTGPGSDVIDTWSKQHIPLGREQTPEDIGDAALYLARANNVTGIALTVAGGAEMG